ncbi:hypothetical protein W97_04044 [Coniosporium apollinis CBS 100218]|uniref:Cardiolipin synthase N-terminal domain-containing protein n=1 Tax=Coniosporium apollinis (strain CBS 100218) TaxID=1168221 RepID=R7YT18_CONA1|nr:uncharacterized protein W97_04044 [Coniosporium apollinis CBS 100218]EON64811.1 hypothetical protein W97_04044 [Coniosporium apollinis CBS 100218]
MTFKGFMKKFSLCILALFWPSLAVILDYGTLKHTWICWILTCLGWLPGVIYAWCHIGGAMSPPDWRLNPEQGAGDRPFRSTKNYIKLSKADKTRAMLVEDDTLVPLIPAASALVAAAEVKLLEKAPTVKPPPTPELTAAPVPAPTFPPEPAPTSPPPPAPTVARQPTTAPVLPAA